MTESSSIRRRRRMSKWVREEEEEKERGWGVTFVAARHSPSLSDMNSREAKKKNKKKAIVVNAESTGAYIFIFFPSFFVLFLFLPPSNRLCESTLKNGTLPLSHTQRQRERDARPRVRATEASLFIFIFF